MAELATIYGERYERDTEQDMGSDWAWRAIEPCDERCHHPVHAFGHPERGMRHLTWFRPESPAVILDWVCGYCENGAHQRCPGYSGALIDGSPEECACPEPHGSGPHDSGVHDG